MESPQNKLFEAATQGSITSLHQLLKDDPLILDRAVVNSFNETPLHVAAMLGHVDFVKEIIELKPQLVNELNSHKSSPLHLASAKGHVDVVRALSSADQGTCLAPDRNELTPLHLAVIKGRDEVVEVLLKAQPDAARLTSYGDETILHMSVKHCQLEALKLLLIIVPEFVNSKDADGNTVLHLAVGDKQVKTIKFLVSLGEVDVNAMNNEGMTAVDVLIRSRSDVRDSEIEKSLKQARGFGSNMETNNNTDTPLIRRMNQNKNSSGGLMKQHSDWLEQKKSTLMIVAVLIATIAFQVGVNPPSGVTQQDNSDSCGITLPSRQQDNFHPDVVVFPRPHQNRLQQNNSDSGVSVMAINFPSLYDLFYIFNTISFVASLSIILLLISGLPLRRTLFMWIVMVITWIAITTIALCYAIAVYVVTPYDAYKETRKPIVRMIGIMISAWALMMALLLITHTIRMIVKFDEKLKEKKIERKSFAAAPSQGNNGNISTAV